MRLSLFYYFVDTFAQILGLEMCACVWACIFLSGIIVSVNTLIVIEINIVYIIRIFMIITSSFVVTVRYQGNVV